MIAGYNKVYPKQRIENFFKELFENLANVWQAIIRQLVGREVSELNNISKFSLGKDGIKFMDNETEF